jgi:hypothetical protein
VNVPESNVEVYRQPGTDGYQSVTQHGTAETLRPEIPP